MSGLSFIERQEREVWKEEAVKLFNDPEYQRWVEEIGYENRCEAMRRRWRDPEYYKKHSEEVRIAKKKWWASLSPEEKKAELQGGLHSEASREARRVATLQSWARYTPEDRLRRMEPTISAQSNESPNKCEALLWEFLEEKFPGVFIPQWMESLRIGRRYPDFYSLGGGEVVIESFGSRYHGPVVGRDEGEIVTEYEILGWVCIVVWANNPGDVIFEWPSIVRQIGRSIGEPLKVR